jgi:peptidoglycan/xylan/chitin deacetylase (PgdA/CDA1 family)
MTAAVVAGVGLALLWFSLKYAWWRPAADPAWPRLLMYHMISAPRRGARFNGLRVAPAMFERQLRWLREHGWCSFTVSELVASSANLPARSFAITFDDGYADNLHAALPLLQKYGCKATLYLVVDRCGRDWSVARKAHHSDGELMREAKLDDAQVRAMLASGCIELGSHSVTHPNFLDLDAGQTLHEMRASKQALEQQFGVTITSFAWPFGLYRPDQLPLLAEAGYSSAVTVEEGIESPRCWTPCQLRRIKISGRDNWLAFRLRLRGGRRGWR